MLNKILNKRHALMNESIDEVKRLIPEMAKELSQMDYHIVYDEETLLREWDMLKRFGSNELEFSVRMRVGMKLCEHFFPNFYEIKNPNGKSFSSEWNEKNLARVLQSVVGYLDSLYMSTVRSRLYMYSGLTKSTMFRPFLAKAICDRYGAKVVLDPCCGFGGRMLGAVASGAKYIGFEPNTETYLNLLKLAKFLGIENKVEIYNDVAENMLNYDFEEVDLILTSPPYFDVEMYCEEETQSHNNYNNYLDWCNNWLFDVIDKAHSKLKPNGVSCWNVHNFETRSMPMIDDVMDYQKSIGFEVQDTFVLVTHDNLTSKRRGGGIRPSSPTIVYKRSKEEVQTYEFIAKKRDIIDKIYAYDKETGNFVSEFDSVSDAAEYFDMDRNNLYGVIDENATRKGHYFKRTFETMNILPWVCEVDGKRYKTIIEAADDLGVTKQAISISRKRNSKKIKGKPVLWND